ncbi:MAG: hypothetical protein ABI890_01950 [Lapillicoccus sp.]
MDTPPTPEELGRVDPRDAQVRDLLASQPPVGPMPADVAALVTDALAEEQEARVRAARDALTALPPVGPMPDDVRMRIAAALRDEQALRTVTAGSSAPSGQRADETPLGTVVPFVRRSRVARRRWTTVLTAVAGVAAVAVLGTVAVRTLSADRPSGVPAVFHVRMSSESYDQAGLGLQARDLLAYPSATLRSTQPASGRLATEAGVDACLQGLGITDVSSVTSVSVDLASYEGTPAAIVVVTTPAGVTAYAVGRDCSAGAPHLLRTGASVP